jgi:hypothetical protein
MGLTDQQRSRFPKRVMNGDNYGELWEPTPTNLHGMHAATSRELER